MQGFSYRLGIIGAGKMGGALCRALVDRGFLDAPQIVAFDVAPAALAKLSEQCPGIASAPDATAVAASAEVILLAVKPQVFADAAAPIAGKIGDDRLIVSIMAGVPIKRIREVLGGSAPIIRTMPNVCCEVAEGAFGYACEDTVSAAQKALVDGWFNGIGAAAELPESLLDAVTGLSGSGPAFVAAFIEALADGGVAAGLPRPVALRLAAQTTLGAAKWVLEQDGPAALKDMVCSPAGTTITGMRALEAGGLRSAAIEAVAAASQRAKELGN